MTDVERLQAELDAQIRLNGELIEQIRLVAPLVRAAIDMFRWESTTDYPNSDPEVRLKRKAFDDALFELEDLHYDEMDIFDEVLGLYY